MYPDLDSVRKQFPSLEISDKNGRHYYFDNPAGTQVPQVVIDRMSDCMVNASANVGGYFSSSLQAAEIAASARRAMADLLNAQSTDEVVFGQNMTSLTFHISRSIGRFLKPGDEIILTRMDHDANIEPWRLLARDCDLSIRWLPFETENFEFDLDKFEELLSSRTRLVCVGAASNLTGTVNDVDKICELTRDAGGWSYVDGVQSAPHILTDVRKTACDFFVCSAYKFFGPHQGILWGRREVLEQLAPYKVRPAPDSLPWSFEPGTQSHEGMAGTAAAVDYLASLSGEIGSERREQLESAYEWIFGHEQRLARRLIDGLKEFEGVRICGISHPDAMLRRVPTVSFTHARHQPADIVRRLSAMNIFAWSGHNYAIEAARLLGIEESGGVVRIGAVHYNTLDEVDLVLDALESILA